MPPPPSFILLLFLPSSPTISFTFPFISFCHALKKGFTFFYWLWVMLSCFFLPRFSRLSSAITVLRPRSHSLTLSLSLSFPSSFFYCSIHPVFIKLFFPNKSRRFNQSMDSVFFSPGVDEENKLVSIAILNLFVLFLAEEKKKWLKKTKKPKTPKKKKEKEYDIIMTTITKHLFKR